MKQFKYLTEKELIGAAYSYFINRWGTAYNLAFASPDNKLLQEKANFLDRRATELRDYLYELEQAERE